VRTVHILSLVVAIIVVALNPSDTCCVEPPAAADKATELKYQKAATRQATLEATLQANGMPVVGPWQQLGPFDPLIRRVQLPDENPSAPEYPLYGGGTGKWRPAPDYLDGYANTIATDDIRKEVLSKKPSIYLRRTIVAPKAMSLKVYLGCDVAFILSLNSKQLAYAGTLNQLEPGQETAVLPLAAGENVLLFKVSLNKKECRFFFLPEWGETVGDALLTRLERDFPTGREILGGYRARAALQSGSAEDRYYGLVEIEPPPGVVLEGTGLRFLPDGRLAVATRRGYVYLVTNPASPRREEIKFQRFAQGLQEPLGLGVVDGKLVVVNRGELTCLLDLDGDNQVDRQENLCNLWGLTGNYHEYAYGLAEDRKKNLYVSLNLTFGSGGPSSVVPYRGCVVRITPGGELQPVCCGLRSPNGIGANAEGDVFVTDNQGDWIPACPLYHVEQGRYFGHPASLRWHAATLGKKGAPIEEPTSDKVDPKPESIPERTLPAVYFPYDELCQSTTDIVCDTTGGKFGPFAGQLFVGEMTKGLIARVQLEKINGRYQGACFLFRRGCGAANRMTFGPEGDLYLTRVNRGWGGGGLGDGLARIEFHDIIPMEVHSIHLQADGFELKFTKPLAPGAGEKIDDYRLEQYAYHHWKTYGSPKIEQEKIDVSAVQVSDDRRSVRLTTHGLKARKVCQFSFSRLPAEDGDVLLHAEAFYTLNEFPNP
jgi:glucose/arabinose dehydrogenase